MITFVYSGPSWPQVWPAYRAIPFLAIASNVAEVVFCDVYINDNYYKTMVSTTATVGTNGHYFDISGIVQEFLNSNPPTNHRSQVIISGGANRFAYSGENSVLVSTQCRFRGSTISGTGVITPETPIPIQRTHDTPPTAGGGVYSNYFYCINAAQQQEDYIGQYESQLIQYRNVAILLGPYGLDQNCQIYGLSRAKKYYLFKDDYCLFPFIIYDLGFNPGTGPSFNTRTCEPRIIGVFPNGSVTVYTPSTADFRTVISHNEVFYMPTGVRNFAAWPNFNTIPFDQFAYYVVALYDIEDSKVVLYSPNVYLKQNIETKVRLWYLNQQGMFEALSFGNTEEKLTTSSSRKLSSAISSGLTDKNRGGYDRFNVRSNEKYAAAGTFNEEEMVMVKELMSSPKVFIEWAGNTVDDLITVGGVNIPPQLIPVRILDGDYVTRKLEDRFIYEVEMEYEMANENIHQRL